MENAVLQVAEVMTRHPVVIQVGKTVVDVAILLKRYDISSVLVMKDKKVKGIIVSDDIVYRVIAQKKDPLKTLVDDVMSTDVISISPKATLEKVMLELNANNVRQLPVMDKDVLVGFITLKDILRIEPTLMDLMTERVRNEEEARQEKIQQILSQEVIDDDLFD